MPNYIVKNCLNTETTVVSASTSYSLGTGVRYYAIGSEDLLCGVIIQETNLTEQALINNELDCCDCILESGSASFSFQPCIGETIDISIQDFCNTYGDVPQLGEYFRIFNTGTSESICGIITGVNINEPSLDWIPDEGPFTSCFECEDIPRSANTEVLVCQICCPCSTGETITQVVPPHPVWTSQYGTAVTQLNMIVLGGENGLNS